MKSYLITDPILYSNDIEKFELNLIEALEKNKVDLICFRDKKNYSYEKYARKLALIARQYNIKELYVNKYIDLACELKATGVHLTSKQFNQIKHVKDLGLKVIISCHNELEIRVAIRQKVDYITYSPIFETANKGEQKGINNLKYIVNKYKEIKIFALGGIINDEQINNIKESKAYGFASIRYFLNNNN